MSKQYRDDRTFADKAYRSTRLEASYTQGKIETMLAEIGITDVRVTKAGDDYTFEFLVRLQRGDSPRKVRINIPLTKIDGERDKKFQHRKDVLFRVLYYHLKDKFVAIKNGLKEFEEEFLADLVVVANGKETRLGDVIVPQYKQQLKTEKVAILSIKGE